MPMAGTAAVALSSIVSLSVIIAAEVKDRNVVSPALAPEFCRISSTFQTQLVGAQIEQE